MGPDLAELAETGLETLDLDDPSRLIEAYIDQLNVQGGINGNCFGLVSYHWGVASTQADHKTICAELPNQKPLVLFVLRFNSQLFECLTFETKIPTIAFYSSIHDSLLARSPANLYLERSTTRKIFSDTLATAVESGHLTADNKIGLVFPGSVERAVEDDSDPDASEFSDLLSQATTSNAFIEWLVDQQTNALGLDIVAKVTIPGKFQTADIWAAEKATGSLQFNLTEDQARQVRDAVRALPVEQAGLLVEMEEYWISTVDDFFLRDVDTVITGIDWVNLRRMMRAADGIGWTPRWLSNDSHSVPLLLTDTPQRQAENLLQVSAARAAGDSVAQLDRDCITLRNLADDAPSFTHRVHTDAWNLATLTCDYLDAVFAAAGRVQGELTSDKLIVELDRTNYQTPGGSLIRFTPNDHYGSDRVRVLTADPACVLNDWGCMRSSTDWINVEAGDSGEGG